MKNSFFASGIFLMTIVGFFLLACPGQAHSLAAPGNLPRGAGLYDSWFDMLGVTPPQGSMPIWQRQNNATLSGADTWRCVSCHGWDYQGAQGAYKSGTNFTGFPGLIKAGQEKTSAQIVAILSGKSDPAHDFSPYLSEQDLNDLAFFLNKGLIDDTVLIDPVSFHVNGGDAVRGNQLYNAGCSSCHGQDGTKIVFRFEGQNASLGDLATLDPWRFLHKSRFGTPGTAMPVGYELGWTPQEGRDTLLFARSLPRQISIRQPAAVMLESREVPSRVGGPANNLFSGIFTALSAMSVGLGFSLISAAAMVGVLLLVVWLLRGRR